MKLHNFPFTKLLPHHQFLQNQPQSSIFFQMWVADCRLWNRQSSQMNFHNFPSEKLLSHHWFLQNQPWPLIYIRWGLQNPIIHSKVYPSAMRIADCRRPIILHDLISSLCRLRVAEHTLNLINFSPYKFYTILLCVFLGEIQEWFTFSCLTDLGRVLT